VSQFLNRGISSSSHNLQPGGPGFFCSGLFVPVDELPFLWLKSLICSVFSIRVPSHSQRVPVLRCSRVALTLPSQLQYLYLS
jgi:hypothetical protein